MMSRMGWTSHGPSSIAYKNGWINLTGGAVTISPSAGDYLWASVVSIVAFAGTDTITPPAGWTAVASRTWAATSSAYKARHTIYQKLIATGSEGTQTWSGVTPLVFAVYVTSWTGVDSTVGIEANTNGGVPGDGATPIATAQSFPSVTSLTANAMIVTTAYSGDSSSTAPPTVWPTIGPTGFTTAASSDAVLGANYKIQPTAGATGTLNVTLDSDVIAWSAWTLSLKAA